MSKHESTEQMLSRMAKEREENDALKRGLTVPELRTLQFRCEHEWVNKGYYDECPKCDAGRA
jgi:hypothetical protein